MTYRYWEFVIFLVVSEKVGTGKKSLYQYWTNLIPEKFSTGKSLGTGIRKNWYQKKVSEPVSEKFGTEKSTVSEKSIGIGIV